MPTAVEEVPEWLDRDYCQSLLRENVKGLFVVSGLEVTSAVTKGENYASKLHRVAVTLTKGGKSEQHYVIIKSLPTSEMLKKLLVEQGVFDRETRMYRITLPALHELEVQSVQGPVEPFFCRSFKTSRPNTLVMEDLSKKGYKVANRFTGLDLDHSKLAMKAMARLHALSIGLKARDPTALEPFKEVMMVEANKEMNQAFVVPSMNMLASKVEKWEGYERFAPRLKSIQWTDRLTEMFKIKDGVGVLNHGDGWLNNMMFQYSDKGEVQNFMFVDFQMARFAPPGIDIQYFMHSSPSPDVREKHWDTLLEEYHATFVKTLTAVGGDPKMMTFKDLKKEVDSRMLYGLFTACVILPIVLADPTDAIDMDKFLDFDNYEKLAEANDVGKAYNTPRYRAVFQNLLRRFEAIGIV